MSASQADFEELYHQAPCGYLTIRDDGTIIGVNETFLRWTGHDAARLAGTSFPGLLPIGDQVLWSTHCLPLLTMVGTVTELAVEIVGADGVRRPGLLSASRHPGQGKDPAEVRVVVFSARERRHYERELMAARRRADLSEAQRADAEAELRRLALQDPLTGLPNRSALEAHLASLFSAPASSSARGRAALLYVDLDHLKVVNESLGRAAGDDLLRVVAERLRRVTGDPGLVARLPGDEFVVVLVPDAEAELAAPLGAPAETPTAAQAVGVLARRLLGSLQEPMTIDGLEVVATASIGCALECADSDTPERLLRNAEIAMHRAKGRGRNGWQLHDPSVVEPAAHRLQLIGELRRAVMHGELRVHYQPRIDLASGRLHGVEALVRWQHPTRGLLAPGHFIEAAEESGLVRGLGAHVLDEAVAQAADWGRREDASAVEVSVNLSPRQLADPHLLDVVTAILDRRGLDPALLTLEITETALMTDPDAALCTLTALKAAGVKIAVDDFGTGYASFTYLQRFPVDELKIDRSFVSGLGVSSGDAAIVASCVQLARGIGIRSVAEGVETEEQRRELIDLGCDLAQGYLLSRPVPATELAPWLDGGRVLARTGTTGDDADRR